MHLQQNNMIELSDVSVSYGDHTVLSHVSFGINEGDFVAITGPNGGGKTTFLRVILQLLKPSTGTITYRWMGKTVDKLNVGYLPQKNMIDSRFPITVEEVVASGLENNHKLFHRTTDDERRRVAETLEMVGLTSQRNASIGNLSGGQLQRALLGRAIISNPNVLVLDEPLSYVDKNFEAHLYDIIAEIAKHTTVILVSHEMTMISQMANRHLIINHSLHECHAAHHYVKSECE